MGMSVVARKKKIRGGRWSVVTKRLGEVEAVLEGDRPDPVKLGQLKLILLEVLRQLDKEIVDGQDSPGERDRSSRCVQSRNI